MPLESNGIVCLLWSVRDCNRILNTHFDIFQKYKMKQFGNGLDIYFK
jgi:hypothetical protein